MVLPDKISLPITIIAAFVFPLGNIGLPLVIYWREKNKSVYSSAEAKEALNFQITMTLMVALIIVLSFILIGFFFLAAWCVAQFYFTSQALDTVGQNEHYRYPINFRIIK